MSRIIHKVSDVFSVPLLPNSYIAHACNCHGDWGKGFAAQLAARYPEAYDKHRIYCTYNEVPTGTSQVIDSIVCLFTSKGYGKRKDSQEDILQATRLAVADFLEKVPGHFICVHSPLINAGLFGVPWHETAAHIAKALDESEKEVLWVAHSL
jgi:ADP-ribose 1''-phosphate phosphatase